MWVLLRSLFIIYNPRIYITKPEDKKDCNSFYIQNYQTEQKYTISYDTPLVFLSYLQLNSQEHIQEAITKLYTKGGQPVFFEGGLNRERQQYNLNQFFHLFCYPVHYQLFPGTRSVGYYKTTHKHKNSYKSVFFFGQLLK